jgi:hypothetical protein
LDSFHLLRQPSLFVRCENDAVAQALHLSSVKSLELGTVGSGPLVLGVDACCNGVEYMLMMMVVVVMGVRVVVRTVRVRDFRGWRDVQIGIGDSDTVSFGCGTGAFLGGSSGGNDLLVS